METVKNLKTGLINVFSRLIVVIFIQERELSWVAIYLLK